ncbi:MAG: aquaporin family protein, partial [Mesorhizobium sp.]
SLTDTFSGIRPADLPGFIVAELLGALIALALMGWLLQPETIEHPNPREPSPRANP